MSKCSRHRCPSNRSLRLEHLEGRHLFSGTPPTTSGIADVHVQVDAADYVISLYGAFDDAETADVDMTYELVYGGYGYLFDVLEVDEYGQFVDGNLTLDFASGAYGDASVTIRATDSDDMSVETTFSVHINRVPTVVGISNVYVDEDASDAVISLYSAFEDDRDADSELSFDVVGNTNGSLLNDISTDSYGGLVLDFAENAFGESTLTIRATDTEGLWCETTFTVYVASVNDAPMVSSPISSVYASEDDSNQTVPLSSSFSDIEGDTLTYAVVGNSHASLFDSLDIDSSGGLILDFAANAHGDASITVRATDSNGLWIEETFGVYVESVDDAPEITGFSASYGYGDYWTLSGTVADIDDSLDTINVVFGGVLAGYNASVSVQADGSFLLHAEFPGLQSGTATAQAWDGSSHASDWAEYCV